ncbi:hypothetical protein ACE6H2_025411 [Prunus campanulata]
MNVGDDDDDITKPQRPQHQRHPITQKPSSPSKPCGHRHHLRRRVVDLHRDLALSRFLRSPLALPCPSNPHSIPQSQPLTLLTTITTSSGWKRISPKTKSIFPCHRS